MKKSNFSFIFFWKKIDFERLIFRGKTRKMYFFQKTTCNFIKRGYTTLLSHLRRDGRAVEGAALEMLFRRNPNASSNLALSAIFFAPIRIFKSESVCAPNAKTRWHKGFYKPYRCVFETHSDSRIRPLFRKNPPFSVWILTIPGKPQKLVSFHKSFIINNNSFWNPT